MSSAQRRLAKTSALNVDTGITKRDEHLQIRRTACAVACFSWPEIYYRPCRAKHEIEPALCHPTTACSARRDTQTAHRPPSISTVGDTAEAVYRHILTAAATDVLCRFEKSLYDLIRGLRNHKGSEGEYIQNSLKECRAEIKSQDMG
ncbi:hypothetical protein H113_06369 [Trichophyton rubrum MR1459]|nr:hypothetical protein H113_06369 [Trichophyton rubrum MR1459]